MKKETKKERKPSSGLEFKKVTWYSQVIAIILYIGTFFWAFNLGIECGESIGVIGVTTQQQSFGSSMEKIVGSGIFTCSENRAIYAQFFKNEVKLMLSDGRNMTLPQTISASGARYANSDESFVFWNKGDTAFVEEGNETSFVDCIIAK